MGSETSSKNKMRRFHFFFEVGCIYNAKKYCAGLVWSETTGLLYYNYLGGNFNSLNRLDLSSQSNFKQFNCWDRQRINDHYGNIQQQYFCSFLQFFDSLGRQHYTVKIMIRILSLINLRVRRFIGVSLRKVTATERELL